MNIAQCMTTRVVIITPVNTVREAALMMAEAGVGILPVSQDNRLVGVVTDRDIAVRAVGAGKGPDCPVREVMSADVKFCFEDDDVAQAAQDMAQVQVRRLPVVDRQKRLVGMVSVGDLAREADSGLAGRVIGALAAHPAGGVNASPL